MVRRPRPEYFWGGGVMVAPVAVRGRDLRALAAIVSEDRLDLAAGEGLPPSLLADLMSQIRCDCVALSGIDSARQEKWVSQGIPPDEDEQVTASTYWRHYWDCEISSYPDRSGDLRFGAPGRQHRQLGISEGTVRTHLENIYTRLNVSSRTAAVTRVFPDRFA